MKRSICGINCSECQFFGECSGCTETAGCPFGKKCIAAKYIERGGIEAYQALKKKLIDEINELDVPYMAEIDELYPLVGSYINLAYPLPSGEKTKFLDDNELYLGAQAESVTENEGKCFGVITNTDFLLVCRYGENGSEPELLLFKKRKLI